MEFWPLTSMLDLRFKIKLADYYFLMIYESEVLDLEIEKVIKFCHVLLNEYKKNT